MTEDAHAGPNDGDVAAALADVRARIDAAVKRSARPAGSVTLVGASKTVPAERIALALDAGLRDLGENRAQELLAKAPLLAAHVARPRWHLLGRLQRNKVAALAPLVSLWHTVDRVPLGEAIAKRAPGARVLVEVNLGGEPQKGGCGPTEVPVLVEQLRSLGLAVAGLMTVPPQTGEARRWFATLRELAHAESLQELSMGMTQDYETAIEEGATLVRVGRGIFGERHAPRVGGDPALG